MNKRELLAERERLYEEKSILAEQEKALRKQMSEITKQLKQYCLEDGHDWNQSSWGNRGHYWNCKICYHQASGRHVDRPDKWYDIPSKDRLRPKGPFKKVRIYNTGYGPI